MHMIECVVTHQNIIVTIMWFNAVYYDYLFDLFV